MFDLQHWGKTSNVHSALNFTSARDSSWAWVQRYLLQQGRRTCFRCSVASGRMSPTVCCYRCWGRLLPESLFSSTLPRKPTKPHKQAKSASWPAQVLYWAELHHDFWHETRFIYYIIILLVFLKQKIKYPVEVFSTATVNMKELKNKPAQSASPE